MSVFGSMLDQLGLSTDEAARFLGLAPITVARKRQGKRSVSDEEVRLLRDLFYLSQRADISRLPQGVQDAALARKVLRGVCPLPAKAPTADQA